MIKALEQEDGSIQISWDDEDPEEAVLSDWTEQEFLDCIADGVSTAFEQLEKMESSGSKAKE